MAENDTALMRARDIALALSLLSRLPVRCGSYARGARAAWAYPLAGLVVGGLAALGGLVALWCGLPSPLAALIALALGIVTTGAMHEDGLADSADGLLGHRDQKTVLSIMKDSRIGVMGMVAVFCALAVKFAGIAAMPLHASFQRLLILLLVPGLARSSMIFGIHLLPYGRPGGGTGFDLFEAPIHFKDFWGLGICLLLCLFLGWRGLWIILVFFGLVFGIVFYYRRRMGCITGDMLGAMTEATESLMFLLACIGGMGSP